MEPILGIQASCLVPSTDITVVNGGVCAWLVCRWPGKELDQPAPWNRLGNICHGYIPDAVGLVCTQKGEQENPTPRPFEVGGKSTLSNSFRPQLTLRYRFTAGSVAPCVSWELSRYLWD